jgi:hypothetical protein
MTHYGIEILRNCGPLLPALSPSEMHLPLKNNNQAQNGKIIFLFRKKSRKFRETRSLRLTSGTRPHAKDGRHVPDVLVPEMQFISSLPSLQPAVGPASAATLFLIDVEHRIFQEVPGKE